MQRPIVDGITIRCRDLVASLAFYQDLLGFELEWQDNDMAGLRVPSSAATSASPSIRLFVTRRR